MRRLAVLNSGLQTEDALVVQAAANDSNVAFTLAKRSRGRVHGVVTRHKITGMLDR
jgi:ribosomal protein L22